MSTSPADSLVGQFFHTFDGDGCLRYQGQIVDRPEPGFYLCQLYNNWGEASQCVIHNIGEMERWAFYSSDEQWRTSHQELSRAGKR